MLELLNATAMKDARVIARIGTRVAISCRMTEAYTNNLDIYWSTTNETRSEFSVEQSVTEVHLVIDVVDRKNAGMYTCIAVNREGGALLAVDLVVGSVPEQFEVTVTSFNNALIVRWEEGNNAKSRDERILAFYVQYKAVNGSNRDTMVKRFAASVKETTLRNVEPDVQYLVRMWSENSFGNSSATDKEFVVIDGKCIVHCFALKCSCFFIDRNCHRNVFCHSNTIRNANRIIWWWWWWWWRFINYKY